MSSNAAVANILRPPRWECDFDVVVTEQDGRRSVARVINISEDGFMAEGMVRLPLYSQLKLSLPGRGPVCAEVRWSVENRFGALILD